MKMKWVYENGEKEERLPVITLCGSSKFEESFMTIKRELEEQGNVVMIPMLFSQSSDKEYFDNIPDDAKPNYIDRMHRIHDQKIAMSDAIYVVNIGGYIGSDTQREIDYARRIGTDVIYHEGKCAPNGTGKTIPLYERTGPPFCEFIETWLKGE